MGDHDPFALTRGSRRVGQGGQIFFRDNGGKRRREREGFFQKGRREKNFPFPFVSPRVRMIFSTVDRPDKHP